MVYSIQIQNVNIRIKAKTEAEQYQFECFRPMLKDIRVSAETICKWCILHDISYVTKFRLYKFSENRLMQNMSDFIEYIGLKSSLNSFFRNVNQKSMFSWQPKR